MAEANHIYQFSLLNALMDGVCETGIPASKLQSKGNIGLGTFARMDGELLLLDDKVYQLQPEGVIREAGPDDQIPFAVATNFQAQQVQDKVVLRDKQGIEDVLESFDAHAKNLFMTYKIEGTFEYLKCRTVRGQEYKGQPLSELGEKQSVEEYEQVEGTVVGFRSPKNWQGFAVAGEHLHFISGDRKKGGHVLELRTGSAGIKMSMAVASNVHIELPTSEDFNSANLVTDDAGVKKVEG